MTRRGDTGVRRALKESMRIGIVAPGELFGGVERQILDLCQIMSSDDEVTIQPVLFFEGELAGRLRERGHTPAVCSDCGGYNPRAVGFLRRWGHGWRPDLLHLHGYKATVTAALARLGVPVVKTEHGLPEPMPGNVAQAARSGLTRRLDTWATRHLSATVCYVTEDIGQRLSLQHRDLQRHTIHNGIVPLERDHFPRPADLPSGPCHVGIVGRVAPVKGIDYALRALADPALSDRIVLDIIGDGPSRPSLEAEAVRMGVADRVRFLGFRKDIYSFLAHLDVMFIPSRHEGLPYTLLEAMSLARPIAASRVGGLAEVLRDGETGLLFDVGDVRGMVHALNRLALDGDLAARLGATAASEQRRRFTLSRMKEKYLAVYRETLSRGTGMRREKD